MDWSSMRAFDPFLVLVGNRGAIERSARTPWALLVGALFVVTAGIARNYDHLYFLAEWEWIYGPFLASIVSAVFIGTVCRFEIYLAVSNAEVREREYRVRFFPFLALFWLTAPCAWIYALPVERWGDLLFATKWNLAFLLIVSVWRVLIIARAVSVLTNARWLLSLLSILVPAAFEVAVVSGLKSMSLVGVMGGVRLPPHHHFLREATATVGQVAFWVFIIGFFVMTFACARNRVENRETMTAFPDWEKGSGCKRAIQIALGFVVLWVLIALRPQVSVRNSWTLTDLVDRNRFAAAVEFASEHGRDAFSRIHYLPPRPYSGRNNDRLRVLLTHLSQDSPQWLREEWAENFVLSIGAGYHWDLRFRENSETNEEGGNPCGL